MPRTLRLILPGVAVHIIQRGNNRAACFGVEADYLVYLSNLRQLSVEHHCSVHAYCLMTNHVHLLLTPQDRASCTVLMRNLGQRYVQYFNRRHDRTGTLWEGRYRSCLVESARYLIACYRYIEDNPVRAAMVNHPASYLWSSYPMNSGTRLDPFISPHSEFLALANEPTERHAAYRALFDNDIDEVLLETIRDATNSGYPLASDAFKTSVLKPLGWKTGPSKSGPKQDSGSDPELAKQVRALTPN